MRPLWLMLGAAFLSSAAQAAPVTYSAALQRAGEAPTLQARAWRLLTESGFPNRG